MQKCHVLPSVVTRRSMLLEGDVRLIHIFTLRYEEDREHAMIAFPINGHCFFFFNLKNKGQLCDPVSKHIIRLYVQSVTASP